MIKRQLHPEWDLVVHEVIGELTGSALHDAGVALYALNPVPRYSLWDLSRASVSGFDLDLIRSVQPRLVRKVTGREGGKTAVIAPSDVTFGVMRQYLAAAGASELPFEQQVFRSRDQALSWLGLEGVSLERSERPGA